VNKKCKNMWTFLTIPHYLNIIAVAYRLHECTVPVCFCILVSGRYTVVKLPPVTSKDFEVLKLAVSAATLNIFNFRNSYCY